MRWKSGSTKSLRRGLPSSVGSSDFEAVVTCHHSGLSLGFGRRVLLPFASFIALRFPDSMRCAGRGTHACSIKEVALSPAQTTDLQFSENLPDAFSRHQRGFAAYLDIEEPRLMRFSRNSHSIYGFLEDRWT